MPRDGSGNYTQPVSSVSPAVTNTTISSTDFNGLMTDISTEMTDSFDRSGKGAMLAALAMGGFKITNLGAPSIGSDAARFDSITSLALAGDITGTPSTTNVAKVQGVTTGAPTGTGSVVFSTTPTISKPAIVGLNSGAFASAGNVGEVVASAATIGIVSGAASNITSIAPTAGNWILFAETNTGPAGSTTTAGFNSAISTTSSSLTPVNGAAVTLLISLPAGQSLVLPVGIAVVSISSTTTYFLVTQMSFASGTMNVGGRLTAVRIS